MNKLIAIAGGGWGFWAAYSSLKRKFDKIELVTLDDVYKSNIRSNDVLLNDIVEARAEILICAGYKPIISNNFLSSKDVINIHYSLLPKYRGMHSTVWAILNNEEYLGFSIHLMNENIDDGPILYQYRKKNNELWTSANFMEHFNDQVSKVLADVILDYLKGLISPKKQDKNLATWVGRRHKQHCMFDFNRTFDYTQRFFRALVYPYPLPYFIHKKIEY
jgi:methionyl-tRNA formyltransferase